MASRENAKSDPLENPDPVQRAAAAAAIGVKGAASPEVLARLEVLAADDDADVRGCALGALVRLASASQEVWERATTDRDTRVRRRAAEVAPDAGLEVAPALVRLLADADPLVAEAAAFALGELADEAVAAGATQALRRAARDHDDPLVRESAVAALGSLGDPVGLDAVLAAMHDRPPIRRRAVLALAAFEGEDVESAIKAALTDRDWQVRQAAEDLTRH